MNAPPSPPHSLRAALEAGRFAITAEITPPVAGDAAPLLEKAEPLRDLVEAVNVTDGASARVHLSNLAAAALLVRAGIEPVLQLTCRDRNRIALQSDLLGAAALGVHNLLVLRGDDPTAGDHPDASGVFDLESRELIRAAREMSDAHRLLSGAEVSHPPSFFIGAADALSDPGEDWSPAGLAAKADAGARFVQTQFCFDPELVERYLKRLAEHGLADRLYFLIGVGPIPSARSARWMRENLFGSVIPDALIERLEGARDPRAEGVAICAELIGRLAEIPGVAGAHVMSPGFAAGVPDAIRLARAAIG